MLATFNTSCMCLLNVLNVVSVACACIADICQVQHVRTFQFGYETHVHAHTKSFCAESCDDTPEVELRNIDLF